jgi:RES domain-containing protein
MVVYRIYKSALRSKAFSGKGARLHGARWNFPGIPVVYTSQTLSLCVLELLVHAGAVPIKRKMDLEYRPATIPDEAKIFFVEPTGIPSNWRACPYPESTQEFGARLLKDNQYSVISIPSAVIPEERNYLINPLHPDFIKIQLGDPVAFPSDSRLSSFFQ